MMVVLEQVLKNRIMSSQLYIPLANISSEVVPAYSLYRAQSPTFYLT